MIDEVKDQKEEKAIWEKIYHTDARLTAMEGQMTDLSDGVKRIEQYLLHKDPPNTLGWLTAVGGGLVMLFTFVFGMVQYIDITLEPIEQLIESRQTIVEDFGSFKHEMHYEVGRLHENKELMRKEWEEMDSRLDGAEDDIAAVESKASTTRDRLERAENELEKIDLYGSRRWGVQPE